MAAMRVKAPLRLSAAAIRECEGKFPMFLLAALLPILVFPFAQLDGNALERALLPCSVTWLVVESLRSMPSWVARFGPVRINPWYRAFGVVSALSVWWPLLTQHRPPLEIHVLFLGIRALFYLLTAIRIVQVLAHSARVSVQTLCLGAAGYVHLGLTAGLLATVLQLVDPDSFNLGAIAMREELMARLSYFAFITLGSLGYGDVVPASPIGESFAVLLSLSSTLYLSLLVGLLLSRFITSQDSDLVQALEDER
jgi:voltage-gated potassium channel